MIRRVLLVSLVLSVGLLVPACRTRPVSRFTRHYASLVGQVLEPAETLSLPAMFADHAVLQWGRPIPVWGTADPGRRVVVRFAGQVKGAVAGDGGRWVTWLDALGAGGPYELSVSVGLKEITCQDVYVGDVWVCSGQSNMAWPLSQALNGTQEVADANHPRIRLFTVPRRLAAVPQGDVEGAWSLCKPATAGSFSAVGYFFGRELARELDVPIGLINASWGGSPAEAWTPRRVLSELPELADVLEEMDDKLEAHYHRKGEVIEAYEDARDDFRIALAKYMAGVRQGDAGVRGRWHRPDANDADWQTMDLPQPWEQSELGELDGVVWFRKELELPDSWAAKRLILELGPIDDDDETYVNGERVGSIGYDLLRHWQMPRRYPIPGVLVKAGRCVIACRVLDGGGSGGLCGTPGQMKLYRHDDPNCPPISLAGPWRYKVGYRKPEMNVPRPPRPPGLPRSAGSMYNGMIAPLVPYGIAGVIWYQGESNAGRPIQYRKLFPALIASWRQRWGQGSFPFLFVQLANFLAPPRLPDEGGWAWLREAQAMALGDPNNAMAVAIDIGQADDIHPRNKQEVARRLALAALAKVHRRRVVYSGPTYESMKVEGNKVRVRFRHVGDGLVAGRPAATTLRHFALAGADRTFHWADAKVLPPAAPGKPSDTVILWSSRVPRPVAVRYAWASNPEGCNLYNTQGLPAAPFRTDDWPRPENLRRK